jgi:hypothetical protein
MTVPKQLQGGPPIPITDYSTTCHDVWPHVHVVCVPGTTGYRYPLQYATTHTLLFVHTYLYPTSYRVLIPVRPGVCAVCVHHRVCAPLCTHIHSYDPLTQ